ncbi:MAG: NUDIX domain-containing protein [Anaerolineae bacterium]|nr:NUDIX domain-containing protein [Anaerolineae bacterium]
MSQVRRAVDLLYIDQLKDRARQVCKALLWQWDFYIRSTLTEQRTRRVVAQAVVLQGDQVLLIKRASPRVWELPGGSIEKGETPAAAIVREVFEETGVQVRVERELGVYQRLGFRPHDGIVFVCTPIAGMLVAGEETLAARFFPIARLPIGLLPWYREVIRDALHSPTSPCVRRRWLGPSAILASVLIVIGERLHLIE